MVYNKNRNIWIDYLRTFLTVLVVAHHSSLAYTTFAYFDSGTYINSTNPVVDNSRWIGMDIFENFNDIFFMSLMYLISGLFVFNGLIKKGSRKFLADRFRRLAIPFLVAVTLIIPIAYLPSFYLVSHTFDIPLFIMDYIHHQQWPVGPPWFIWLLLLFNVAAALIPASYYTSVSNAVAKISNKPASFFMIAFILVSLAYIPLSLWVGHYKWTGFGPFDFQVNRLPLYLLFFLFGACIGSGDWESYLFTNNKLLNRSWLFWAVLCLVNYFLLELFSYYIQDFVKTGKINMPVAYFIFDLFFVTSCINSSAAFVATFKQIIKKPSAIWSDLSANAFGIYLIHYVFVTWFQYALLAFSWPVIIKFSLVFIGSLLMSWAIIKLVRKLSIVRRII